MHAVTRAILYSNRGRDPQRVKVKLAAIRADAFAFFRGTSALFYDTLALPRALLDSPAVLCCGDLHLQNFGGYKGDNRLVYFDINDFDESCVAPVAFELVRFLTSMRLAGDTLALRDKRTGDLMAAFIDTYATNIAAGKPRWIERSLASGPVKALLQGVKRRHRRDLIRARTRRQSGKGKNNIALIIDGKRTLAASAREREHAAALLASHARAQGAGDFFVPLDIARRIAGNGSLGLARYLALVRGNGKPDGQYLIDIKYTPASSLAPHCGQPQPRWRHEAERVATIQGVMQAIPPALLGAVADGKRSYLIKEMQPSADRVDLSALHGNLATLNAVIRTMAEVAAWGHLRGCGRFGKDGAASGESLSAFAVQKPWRKQVLAQADAAHQRVLQQWQAYAGDYDAGPEQLLAAIAR